MFLDSFKARFSCAGLARSLRLGLGLVLCLFVVNCTPGTVKCPQLTVPVVTDKFVSYPIVLQIDSLTGSCGLSDENFIQNLTISISPAGEESVMPKHAKYPIYVAILHNERGLIAKETFTIATQDNEESEVSLEVTLTFNKDIYADFANLIVLGGFLSTDAQQNP